MFGPLVDTVRHTRDLVAIRDSLAEGRHRVIEEFFNHRMLLTQENFFRNHSAMKWVSWRMLVGLMHAYLLFFAVNLWPHQAEGCLTRVIVSIL